jgi:hypothetical protein
MMGLMMAPRLVRKRLKDMGVSERKQVGDVVALVSGEEEGRGGGEGGHESGGDRRGGGSGFYNPNNEL